MNTAEVKDEGSKKTKYLVGPIEKTGKESPEGHSDLDYLGQHWNDRSENVYSDFLIYLPSPSQSPCTCWLQRCNLLKWLSRPTLLMASVRLLLEQSGSWNHYMCRSRMIYWNDKQKWPAKCVFKALWRCAPAYCISTTLSDSGQTSEKTTIVLHGLATVFGRRISSNMHTAGHEHHLFVQYASWRRHSNLNQPSDQFN